MTSGICCCLSFHLDSFSKRSRVPSRYWIRPSLHSFRVWPIAARGHLPSPWRSWSRPRTRRSAARSPTCLAARRRHRRPLRTSSRAQHCWSSSASCNGRCSRLGCCSFRSGPTVWTGPDERPKYYVAGCGHTEQTPRKVETPSYVAMATNAGQRNWRQKHISAVSSKPCHLVVGAKGQAPTHMISVTPPPPLHCQHTHFSRGSSRIIYAKLTSKQQISGKVPLQTLSDMSDVHIPGLFPSVPTWVAFERFPCIPCLTQSDNVKANKERFILLNQGLRGGLLNWGGGGGGWSVIIRKLGGSVACSPEGNRQIGVPEMTGNALEILQMSCIS